MRFFQCNGNRARNALRRKRWQRLIFALSLESTVLKNSKLEITQGWRVRKYAKSYTIQNSPSSSEKLTFQKKVSIDVETPTI